MRVTFFRVAERKSPKKGRPRCLRPLRFATGQPVVLVRGARCGTRCAPAALRSNSRSESVHEACVLRHTPPHALRSSAHTEGSGSPTAARAIASLGPLLWAQAPCAGRSLFGVERSDDPNGFLGVHSLLAAPAAGRLWGGMGARAPMLRDLTRRGCPSGARQRKASSAAHPATATAQVCPFAPRRGRRLRVAFSLLTFFWRSKRK